MVPSCRFPLPPFQWSISLLFGLIKGLGTEVRNVSDEMLVSFDVASRFTSVPMDEAVEVIHGKTKKGGILWERYPTRLLSCWRLS